MLNKALYKEHVRLTPQKTRFDNVEKKRRGRGHEGPRRRKCPTA
jgi:hypothetical protein